MFAWIRKSLLPGWAGVSMETGVWLILGGKPLELPHSLEKEVEATVLLTTWPQPPPPTPIQRSDDQKGGWPAGQGDKGLVFFLEGGLLSVMKS